MVRRRWCRRRDVSRQDENICDEINSNTNEKESDECEMDVDEDVEIEAGCEVRNDHREGWNW